MLKVKTNKINDYTIEIDVEVSWEEVKIDFSDALKKFGKKIKMPGFRPGKVPRERLLQQFQPNIEADFMEKNFQKYYIAAVEQEDLIPVNKAEISDVKFKMNEPFNFKAKFEVQPDNKLPKFKKNMMTVQKTNYIHDENDIDDAITQLRKSHATVLTIEDGAIEGDFIVCNLQKLDESGLPIIGKKFENQYLKVGNGSFTDDQKEKLIGLKRGDLARLTIPLSKNEDDAEYEIDVKNVEREQLPDLNEDFLKLINPELESLDALRNDVSQKINSNFKERSQNEFEDNLKNEFVKIVDPVIPPSMVENYLESILEDLKKKNPNENLDTEKVKEQYRSTAERNIKWLSLRKLILNQEKLSVGKEETESKLEELILNSPGAEKEIKKYYKKPSNRSQLEQEILDKKLFNFLNQFAKVKEIELETRNLRGK
tara:strand:- start:2535 stop:3815 length:1281 start_codon:yes stop_codon:yes gene_type:complete